jgi:hypothetical protein
VNEERFLKPLSDFLEPEDVAGFLGACTRAISAFYAESEIALRKVALKDIRPVARKIEPARVRRARELLECTRAKDVELFAPIVVGADPASAVWLIFPPIVELHPKRAYLINGHHRLHVARAAGVKRVQVVTVKRVAARAPAEPALWRDVGVTSAWPWDEPPGISRLQEELVRPASSFFRSSYFHYDRLDSLLGWCTWMARSETNYGWNPIVPRLEPRN